MKKVNNDFRIAHLEKFISMGIGLTGRPIPPRELKELEKTLKKLKNGSNNNTILRLQRG